MKEKDLGEKKKSLRKNPCVMITDSSRIKEDQLSPLFVRMINNSKHFPVMFSSFSCCFQ